MSTSNFYSPDIMVSVELYDDGRDAYLEVSCYDLLIPVSLHQVDDLISKLTSKKKELEDSKAICK